MRPENSKWQKVIEQSAVARNLAAAILCYNDFGSDRCSPPVTFIQVSLYRYVLTEVDDVRRVEAVDIGLELGEATYLGFGPSTNMNGIIALHSLSLMHLHLKRCWGVLQVGLSLADGCRQQVHADNGCGFGHGHRYI